MYHDPIKKIETQSVVNTTLIFTKSKRQATNLFGSLISANLVDIKTAIQDWIFDGVKVEKFKDFGIKSAVDFEAKKKRFIKRGNVSWFNDLVKVVGYNNKVLSSYKNAPNRESRPSEISDKIFLSQQVLDEILLNT